jgi:arsenate reductase (glutaredoxin)
LTERGVEFKSVNYMEERLPVSELKDLLRRAGLRPEEVVRTKEAAYKQHVMGKNLSGEDLLKVIAAHPELLQRPIVVRKGKAVLARPMQNLAKLGIRSSR